MTALYLPGGFCGKFVSIQVNGVAVFKTNIVILHHDISIFQGRVPMPIEYYRCTCRATNLFYASGILQGQALDRQVSVAAELKVPGTFFMVPLVNDLTLHINHCLEVFPD